MYRQYMYSQLIHFMPRGFKLAISKQYMYSQLIHFMPRGFKMAISKHLPEQPYLLSQCQYCSRRRRPTRQVNLLRGTKAWDMSFLHYIHRYFKISTVYGNLKDQMKLDLCICEALSYTLVPWKPQLWAWLSITTNIN